MSISKPMLKEVRKDIEAALKAVEAKHGLNLDLGSMTFTENSFTTKLSASVVSADGIDQGKKTEWERNAPMFGLDKDLFGKTFSMNGNQYEITEIKPRSRKYPVIGKDLKTGKSFKFAADTVSSLTK